MESRKTGGQPGKAGAASGLARHMQPTCPEPQAGGAVAPSRYARPGASAKPSIIRTMSPQIAREVRRRILDGTYPAGSQLLQDNIAAEFGVSKIPVREALTRLAAEGLVELQAHRGFQVTMMSRAEACELHDLRLLMEPRICAQGAQMAGPEEHAQAAQALDALCTHIARGQYDDCGELNRDFHLALAAPRLQPVAMELLNRLLTLSQRYAQIHLISSGQPDHDIREHTVIHDAWRKGQAAQVERLITRHIQDTLANLVALLPSDD